ncbi:aspartate ammonia-lyase [Paenarthrobacter sp. CM16]|nr:aspartate ammonia-lyase [Paenarthrobacter sp. CM16]
MHRTERDMLGPLQIPEDAYYGVHTLRASRNFRVTGSSISEFPMLLAALAAVKEAAAMANSEVGGLDAVRTQAIVQACQEIRAGALHDQFIVDPIQGGAGTSTNMNANEVIANRALEILGLPKGSYSNLHPNEDVNRSQSTNDVYPTALKIAAITAGADLIEALRHLRLSFERKAVEFADVIKVGRTQLQDAVPMTLGQEFASYATMMGEDELRLGESLVHLHEINLGATAIGTGITAPPGYAEAARRHLQRITGLPVVTAPNLVEATQDCGAFALYSGTLKRTAIKASKICNDLRLLSSGPRAGLSEINLPPRQAGSSIMPGKVNPVIPEMVNQVAFEVVGNDVTVTMAAEAGQLQLNAFEPIIAYSIFRSVAHLTEACTTLADLCVDGITANKEFLRSQVESSIGVVTVLSPHIGYEASVEVAQDALRTGRSVTDLVIEKNLLPTEVVLMRLSPEMLLGAG